MTIRFGCLGLGWVAREVWLPLVASSPAFDIVGIYDIDATAAQAVRERWADVPICATVDEVVDKLPDVVLVATPNSLHAGLAERLLSTGVSAFVEKPVCLTLHEVSALRAAAACGGARLIRSAATIYRSDVAALSHTIRDGTLGQLRLLELEWVRARGIPRPGAWFTHRAHSGGGVLVDLGWHLLDVALMLLGHFQVAQVAAVTSDDWLRDQYATATWRNDIHKPAQLEQDVEDTATAWLTTTADVVIWLRVAWASHERCDVTRIAIHGTKGAATLRTTFGFSPHRVRHPTIELRRDGEVTNIPFREERIGNEYGTQLDLLRRSMTEHHGLETAFTDLECIVGVVQLIYKAARQTAGGLSPRSEHRP